MRRSCQNGRSGRPASRITARMAARRRVAPPRACQDGGRTGANPPARSLPLKPGLSSGGTSQSNRPAGAGSERNSDGQDDRNRPRHDQLGGRGDGGRRAHRHPQLRGGPHHTLRRRLREGRGAAGRTGRAPPGHHQPHEHGLLDQALHGNAALGGRGGAQAGPLPGRPRHQGSGSRQPAERREELHAPRALRGDPAEDAADRRGLPGRVRQRGRDHRAGVLQRRPAAGHQGLGEDRRARGEAHHQRAHGGRAGLRAGQEVRREDRGLRPWRRHLRHLHPGDRRRRLRGEGDQRRHAPRRRRLRPGPDRLARGRVQAGPGDRPVEGLDGAAAPEGGRREGQDGALLDALDRHQPALHHRHQGGPQAPQLHALAGQVRAAGGPPDPAHHPPHAQGARRRGAEARRHRRGGARRRLDPDPEDPGGGAGLLRAGAAPGGQPRRGGGRRRRDPGRRSGRRGQGRAPPRRDPAVAGDRDPGRRDDRPHRAQHDHPDPQDGGLLHRRGQPDDGRDPRPAGRAQDGDRQPHHRQVPADRHPAGAARRATGRGDLRHRRQRHPARDRQGSSDREGAEGADRRVERAQRRRDRQDGEGRRGERRRGPAATRRGRGAQHPGLARLPGREGHGRVGRQGVGGDARAARRGARAREAGAQGQRHRRDQRGPRRAHAGVQRRGPGDVPGAGGRGRTGE